MYFRVKDLEVNSWTGCSFLQFCDIENLAKISKNLAKLFEFTIGKIKIPKCFVLKNHKFCKGKKQNKKCLWSPWAYKLDKAPVHTGPNLAECLTQKQKVIKTFKNFFKLPIKINIFKQQGVCHTVTLPFTLKSILWQKKNYGNSNISPCKNNLIFKKNPLKEIKILQDIINSISNLKFQHKPKYHLPKILIWKQTYNYPGAKIP